MTPNPLLSALGMSPTDRAVLIHTDDIGMSQASLAAYIDLSDGGMVSAGSVMVPCPWFPATARFCAAHTEQVDMGVHVTLNSEWETGYRWGPVSTRDPASGLMDASGYMHPTTADTQANARPEAVRAEIAAQVQRALDAGIDVTHIDAHMGTAFLPGFVESYVQVALSHRVPPFLVRATPEILKAQGFDGETSAELMGRIQALEAQGLPMFDDVRSATFDTVETHLDQMKRGMASLSPGLTYFITHPAKDTPELRAMIPGRWQQREADYEVLMNEEFRRFIEAQGIRIIGWRLLRDLLRSSL
jgi:chitin disaccharide deacetylase